MSQPPLRVEARLSWAFVAMAATLFAGALLWGLLNPHALDILDYADSFSTSAEATTGVDRVRTIWEYWPLWFGGAVLLYGYQRSVNESQRGL